MSASTNYAFARNIIKIQFVNTKWVRRHGNQSYDIVMQHSVDRRQIKAVWHRKTGPKIIHDDDQFWARCRRCSGGLALYRLKAQCWYIYCRRRSTNVHFGRLNVKRRCEPRPTWATFTFNKVIITKLSLPI